MKYILLFIGVAIITYLLISLVTSDWMWLEKPLYFNPFGQTGLLTLAIKYLTLLVKIILTT